MDVKPLFFRNIKRVDTRQKNSMKQSIELPSDASLEQKVIAAIRTVYDPEIHINVYDLGLIYHIDINDAAEVEIEMTLTAPACPVAEILPAQVAEAIKSVAGISEVKVTLVWDPPWNQSCISDAARLELGLF